MTAIAVNQLRPHPGKLAEFIALGKETKQLAAKHGLTVRLFLSVLAGPAVGTYSAVFEAADLAALAAGLQNITADPAYPSLLDRSVGPDGVATQVSLSQATEIPL